VTGLTALTMGLGKDAKPPVVAPGP
jgi:hypothetical protein